MLAGDEDGSATRTEAVKQFVISIALLDHFVKCQRHDPTQQPNSTLSRLVAGIPPAEKTDGMDVPPKGDQPAAVQHEGTIALQCDFLAVPPLFVIHDPKGCQNYDPT